MRRDRWAGSTWRFLAHYVKDGAKGRAVTAIALDSRDHPSSEFDELVVDRWLHIEMMDVGYWWMDVGGVTVHVTVDRDGRPKRVRVDGPDDFAEAVELCEYVCVWNGPKVGVA